MSRDRRPALLGGAPVRTAPFRIEPMTGSEEEALVLAAMRAKSFSRYIGSPMPDMERVLRMTSREAAEIDDYWHFLGGTQVRAFAAEFAERFEVPFAVPINSATTGLGVALAAAGVGPGDEVIVPAISFPATASAVLLFNSIPVFVDVDPLSFCIDPAAIEAAIGPRTRAILPVHLAGNVADMDAILTIARRHGLKVVEDAAQAIGAAWDDRMAGTLGDAGVFSFQQSKNIMTGEGGMIVTRDAEIARRARLILNHGDVAFDASHGADDLANIVGCNFRMPELCAAVGRAQLARLDAVNDGRTRNAEILRAGLEGLAGLSVPWQRHGGRAREVPHLFVALYDADAMGLPREIFVAALRAEGIPVGTGYARPLYAAPTFLKKIAYGRDGYPWRAGGEESPVAYAMGMCPVAERLLDEEFLWFYHIAYPSTAEDMADIVAALHKLVAARDSLAAAGAHLTGALGARSQGRIGATPSAGTA
jgi:dTDP-4-amino-4,6-dideoxygalactose transaminase